MRPPLQYDALGAFYGHTPGSGPLERLKKRLNTRAFSAAHAIVTWSEWAKASLVTDYGVPGEKITVIPPGVDIKAWGGPERAAGRAPVRLLFVGGDFARKGGEVLLEAWRCLPAAVRQRAELHIVTKSWTEQEEQAIRTRKGDLLAGVFVRRGLQPNSPGLERSVPAGGPVCVPDTRPTACRSPFLRRWRRVCLSLPQRSGRSPRPCSTSRPAG
jgi:glycosyltransferase involved in cell wall biosynthesis